ncbi:hypothetical protein O3M35_002864 [Rhynocoris fuscipes]|uniref:EndoU domain-containing protein n=1 Tax=Rhynocoris fuscipes TaxID=488301 RepID=A0AAW1CQD9_9HEMI
MKLLLILVLVEFNLGARYISDDELKKFCEKLLESDKNNVANFITLNLQGKSKFDDNSDVSPNKLMTVAPGAYKPLTISKVLPLYDNYDADSTHAEEVTKVKKDEEAALLDAFLATDVMIQAKNLLQTKEIAPKNDKDFRNFISDLWFTTFSRGGRKKGSSAFEHIFLGELKKGDISGLHSWIFFNHEEQKDRINYLGWTKKMDFPNNKGSIIKVKYTWKNVTKPAGSMFVGTSPEFDMALYTVCFFARPNDRCNLSVGGKSFFIQSYVFKEGNKDIIGSAYPGI